jgi:hypothetical protein
MSVNLEAKQSVEILLPGSSGLCNHGAYGVEK